MVKKKTSYFFLCFQFLFSIFFSITNIMSNIHQIYETLTPPSLGMARGIPRPSILEVPDLFSLLDSPKNRFYNCSIPRQNSPRTSKIPNFLFEHFKNENVRKFSAICQDFSVLFLFFRRTDQFLVLLPNIPNFKI